MTLQEAQEVAALISTMFKRKALIEPALRHKGADHIAILTSASDIEVGYAFGRANVNGFIGMPKRSRSTPLGRAFF